MYSSKLKKVYSGAFNCVRKHWFLFVFMFVLDCLFVGALFGLHLRLFFSTIDDVNVMMNAVQQVSDSDFLSLDTNLLLNEDFVRAYAAVKWSFLAFVGWVVLAFVFLEGFAWWISYSICDKLVSFKSFLVGLLLVVGITALSFFVSVVVLMGEAQYAAFGLSASFLYFLWYVFLVVLAYVVFVVLSNVGGKLHVSLMNLIVFSIDAVFLVFSSWLSFSVLRKWPVFGLVCLAIVVVLSAFARISMILVNERY